MLRLDFKLNADYVMCGWECMVTLQTLIEKKLGEKEVMEAVTLGLAIRGNMFISVLYRIYKWNRKSFISIFFYFFRLKFVLVPSH